MHVLEILSVLRHTGYMPNQFKAPYISDVTELPPQFGPTEPYVPIYTEFEYYTRKQDVYNKRIVNPLVNPPTGLSNLAISLWLVNRDIGVVKLRLAANPTNIRVFRYASDAQVTATSVTEVVRKQAVAPNVVFECDGFHHELKTECKCRSPNAMPATNIDPIGLQLETLEATAESYAAAMPFKVRVAALEKDAVAAELKAGEAEEGYRHSIKQVSIMDYKKDSPQMSFKWRYTTDTPTHQQKVANEHWARLGKAASEARTEAQIARKAVLDYIAKMEAQALAKLPDQSAKNLATIRENNRNGLPEHPAYIVEYQRAWHSITDDETTDV